MATAWEFITGEFCINFDVRVAGREIISGLSFCRAPRR